MKRHTGPWLGGLALAAGTALFTASSPAQAACVLSGSTVTCSDTDEDGFTGGNNLTITIPTAVFVQSVYDANPANFCPQFRSAVRVGTGTRINNAGRILGRGNCGLGIDAGSGLTLTNDGEILTDSEVAFGILTTSAFDITNRGTIRTVNGGSPAFVGTSNGRFVNGTAGLIETTGADSPGLFVEDGNTITNDGRIITSSSGGYGIDAGSRNTIVNAGTITTSGIASPGVRLRGNNNTFTNTGTITAIPASTPRDGEDSVGVVTEDGNNVLTNNGTIAGDYAGIILSGFGNRLQNNGTITARAPSAASSPGAAIIVESASTIVNTGTIRGNGSAAVLARNVNLQLTNTGRIEGDVVMSGGTGGGIALGTGGVVTGTIFGAASKGSILSLIGSGTIANPIVNMGSLQQIGDGAWTLNRRYDFQFVTMLAVNGTLTLTDGIRANGTIFAQRGRLAGVGVISAVDSGFTPSVLLQSTLAPGLTVGGVGTLLIQGNARFETTARAEFDLTSNTNDRFNVSGALRSGGTIVLNYGGGSVRDGQTFTIVTAGSIAGLSNQACATALQEGGTAGAGCFALTDNAPLFIHSSATVTATSVTTRVQRVSYATVARTPEERDIALVLDRALAAGSNPLGLTARLDTMTAAEAQPLFASLTTDSPVAAQTWGVLAGQSVISNLAPWLDVSASDSARGSWRTWGGGFLRDGESGPKTDSANFDYEMKGVVAGIDGAVADGTRIGLMVAHVEGETFFAAGVARNDLDMTSAGLYVAQAWDAWSASAGVVVSDGSWRSTRANTYVDPLALVVPTLAARADTGAESAFAQASYVVENGMWLIKPAASLTYVRTKTGALNETVATALVTQRETATSLRGEIGVRAVASTGPVHIDVAAFWSHDFKDTDRTVRARIAGITGSDFSIVGRTEKRGLLNTQAGVNIEVSPSLMARLGWSGILNDRLGGHTASAGLSYRW